MGRPMRRISKYAGGIGLCPQHPATDSDIRGSTARRTASCPCCGSTTTRRYVDQGGGKRKALTSVENELELFVEAAMAS